MASSDRNSQKENKSRGNEPNFNWRGVILIAIAFALIGLAVLFRGGAYQALTKTFPTIDSSSCSTASRSLTTKIIRCSLVIEEGRPTQTLRGYYLKQGAGGAPTQQAPFRTTIYLNYNTDLQDNDWRLPEFSRRFGPNPMCWRKHSSAFSRSRVFLAHSLSPFPPADPHGRQRRAEFRQEQGAHARARQKQDHIPRRRRRRGSER